MSRKRKASYPHLHQDSRTGIYVWRRTDPLTGQRVKRTTGVARIDLALRKAATFEDEWAKRRAGIQTLTGWKKELLPLAEEWIRFQEREGSASAPVLSAKRFRIHRALEELNLRKAADLTNVSRLHDQLLARANETTTKAHLREAWQEPLKQFSKWLAENGRYLERDPLATWKPIPKEGRGKRARRAFYPSEVARALQAADVIDVINGRDHSTRMIFLVLLITAPRTSALASRNVCHFEPEHARIEFGEDNGNKRTGAGALDQATVREIEAYLGERTEGPLLLSPKGARLRVERLLDYWREAFGLGLLADLWPEGVPWEVNEAYVVNRTLLTGKVKVSKGGNPKRVSQETVRARLKREQEILQLTALVRAEWEERMKGVDVHAFRKTHRTWALAQSVPEVLIDKQLGHAHRLSAESMDLLRIVAGSRMARKHYVDLRSRLLEASRPAEAVRALLDEALTQLGEDLGPIRVSQPSGPHFGPHGISAP